MATADTKRNKWPYKAIIMGGLILCLTTVISEVAIHYRTAQLLEASVAHATE